MRSFSLHWLLAHRWLALLLALNLLSRLYFALGPLGYLDSNLLVDDTYLCLTLARNLAAGLGPLYDHAPTSGFQPLYVFLIAPCFWLSADPLFPLRGALVLLALCDTAAFGVLCLWLRRRVENPAALAVPGAAWLLNPYVLFTTLNGMETMLACLTLFIVLAWFDHLDASARRAEVRGHFVLGLLFATAALARIDALLLGPLLAVALLWRMRNELRRGAWLRPALAACGGFCALYLPFAFWLHSQTGDWLPVSGRAVRQLAIALEPEPVNLNQLSLQRIGLGWRVLTNYNARPLTLAALLAAGLLLLTAMRAGGQPRLCKAILREMLPPLRPVLLPLLFSGAIFLGYTILVPGWWFYPRYLFPLTLPLLVALPLLTDRVLAQVPAPRRQFVAALLALGAASLVARAPLMRMVISRLPGDAEGYYMKVGAWANQRVPPGSVLGSTQTGALGYFVRHSRVVNLDGVVNREAFDALRDYRLMEYARSQGVEYLLDWDSLFRMLQRRSRGFSLKQLEPLGTMPDIRPKQAWILYRVPGKAG